MAILFACIIFSSVPAPAQERSMQEFSIVLEKIKQNTFPLKTLELGFYSERGKDGVFSSREDDCRAKIDFEQNRATWEFIRPEKKGLSEEIRSFNFFDNALSTTIVIPKRGKKPKNMIRFDTPTVHIRRDSSPLPFPSELSLIIEHNSLDQPGHGSVKPRFPFFINGMLPFEKPMFERIEYKGETALKITSSPTLQENVSKEVFIFSEKTGALLEKRSSSGKKKEGKIVEEFYNKVTYSNFLNYNGILFPLSIQILLQDGWQQRITIKKETVRINEPIDPKEFVPKIPGGANVRDEINGIRYTTPVIGNPEAMKELEADLNAYFEKVDNGKPKTAPKPTTK
jgi:hypothetical protein